MTHRQQVRVPTVAIHTDIFERVVRSVAPRQRHARHAATPSCPSRSWARRRASCAPTSTATTRSPAGPVMQEVIEGLTRPFDDEDLQKVGLRALHAAPGRARTPRTNLHQLFLDNNWTDKLPIVLPTEERVAEMLAGTSHKPDEVVGHMRPTHFREYWEYTVEKVAVNAVMAGARPEYFPVILALAASGVQRARQHDQLDGGDGRRQRPDPPRDRHELRHRRAGPVQPRQRDDRPRLRPAVAEPAGRLGRRPDLHGLAGQRLRVTTTSPSPRTRSAARGSRSTSQHGFKPSRQHGQRVRRLPAHGVHARACASAHWREHVRNMLRGMDPHEQPLFVLDPITARQFIDRGGFDTKEKLIDWVYENALHAGRRVLGLPADPELRLPARHVRRGAVRLEAQGRRRRADPHVPARRASTSSSSAARPTATGASSARATARPCPSTSGGRRDNP